MKRSYSTNLTDIEWECLEPHVPAPSKRGRPRSHAIRKILNAVFYVLKSGCPWRLLPREFPLRRLSIAGSDDGEWTARGRGWMRRCANACGYSWADTPIRA